jgi:hypothetical protein
MGAVLPASLTYKLSDFCGATASWDDRWDDRQIDCWLLPSHSGDHFDKNFHVWWRSEEDGEET